jgi:hypothetical protein
MDCTYRLVFALVVDMHKASIDVGQILQLILQVLRNIVSSPERHLAVQDNIDLHVILWARMANTTAVDGLDVAVEGHGLREIELARRRLQGCDSVLCR